MESSSVSVVIPAYRAAGTIRRAVESVLAQTLPAFEIIVVDDGSPDDLPSALAPFGGGVRLLRKSNGGAASARNHGIDASTGDLIAFLDADDYWEPLKLRRQCDVLSKHPDVGLVASRYFNQPPCCERVVERFDRSRWLTRSRWLDHSRWLDRPVTLSGPAAFALTARVWTGAVVLRRTSLGDHRFVPGLEPAEDRDLWLRLIDGRPTVVLSEPLATAVLEPHSLSRSSADVGYSQMIRVLRRHAHRVTPRALRKLEANVYRAWAGQHLGDRRPDAALPPAWERLRRQPVSPEAWRILAKCGWRAWRSEPATPMV